MRESVPLYLDGQLAPVPDEIDAVDLPVTGTLPVELTGRYFRNGPNPLPGEDPGHWFTGHGMIHGVRIRDGQAHWYRNRWVRTRRLEGAERQREDGSIDLTVGAANTHIIEHAGKLLALVESCVPYEMTSELDTIGPCDFGGRLTTAMTAHPKEDPDTGELHFFGYAVRQPPYVTYHRLSPDGQLQSTVPVDVPGPTMMHDFGITEHHVIWLDLPMSFQFSLVGKGMPFQWDDGYGARIGVMPKDGGTIRWFEVEPCYVFHVGNAREDSAGRIVLDVVRYSRDAWNGVWSRIGGASPHDHGVSGAVSSRTSRLHRWTLDPATGSVHEEQVSDQGVEFPTVNDAHVGRANRYLYTVGGEKVVKFDTETGYADAHYIGTGWNAGEATFVPAAHARNEDDGWLLSIITHSDPAVASELLVLDATDLSGKPTASIRLPRRVPAGFHGSWIPDAELKELNL
jgi:carotenoid cleavage dioxygenase-like enzyme